MICWLLLIPVLVSLLLSCFFPQEGVLFLHGFAGSSCFGLGFRCLSPFFSLLSFLRTGVLFHHDLLVPCLPSSLFFLSSGKGFCSIMICCFLVVPGGVPVLVSLLLSSPGQGFCSIMICWFLLVPAGVPVFISLLPVVSLRKRILFHHGFRGLSCSRLGFRRLSPFFSLLSFLNRSVPDSSMNFELHMTLVETCVVAVWGLCWCHFLFSSKRAINKKYLVQEHYLVGKIFFTLIYHFQSSGIYIHIYIYIFNIYTYIYISI